MSNISNLNPKSRGLLYQSFMNIKGIILVTVIFGPLFIINGSQMLSTVLIPFSPKLFRAYNRFLANYYWGFLVFLLEKVNGINVEISGDEIPMEENAVVDSNHQNVSDIPILMVLAWKKRRLGDMKFFAKDIIKYFPGPGWGMLFLDCLFVKRNWLSDKAKIDSTFRKFKTHKIPVWIVSFLEGTRITPEKLKRSQAFMKRRGLPHTENVMAPRTKGFIATVNSLREELDAAYTITLMYPEGVPNLWQLLKGECRYVRMHVRRTEIEKLPVEEEALEKWVINEYVTKDKIIDEFRKTYSTSPSNTQGLEELSLNPS